MTRKMKVCPFCACKKVKTLTVPSMGDNQKVHFVTKCTKCSTSGPIGISQEQAAELWNTRNAPEVSKLKPVAWIIEFSNGVFSRPTTNKHEANHFRAQGKKVNNLVLYNDAASLISVKDAEIELKRKANDKLSRKVVVADERARNAEDKLEHIEAQSPIGSLYKNFMGTISVEGIESISNDMAINSHTDIYMAPVVCEADTLERVLYSVAECLSGLDHSQVSPNARRVIEHSIRLTSGVGTS